MSLETIHIESPERGPEVRLLDATSAEVDEQRLRATARALADAAGAAYASRSYRYPYALVTWHSDSVGIDIERVEPHDPAFTASICTPAERVWVHAGGAGAQSSSLWSSKEALAKALGNALDYDPRRLESPMFWANGRSGRWRATTLPVAAGHVAWLCWRAAE
jgi:phosphopantetheinyl transferase